MKSEKEDRLGEIIMKKIFEINARKIIATILGCLVFILFFMYAKIPTGVPETYIQIACGIASSFAAIFGPIPAGIMAFAGHAIADKILYDTIWWSWAIADGITYIILGILCLELNFENSKFDLRKVFRFNGYQFVANFIGWSVIAPVLDIILYSEPVTLVFTQGMVAGILNIGATGVFGTSLLIIFSKVKKSQLKKNYKE